MRSHQQRPPKSPGDVHVPQHLEDVPFRHMVKVAGRFVADQQLRLANQHAGNRHALLLSTALLRHQRLGTPHS